MLDPFVSRPRYWIERIRQAARDRILGVLGEAPSAGILVALAIGDQPAIAPAQWTVFTRTGVNHLMSISGLHITMVSGLVFAVVAWCWRRVPAATTRHRSPQRGCTGRIVAALLYALLSGFGVPAQRTVFMLAVVAIALVMGRGTSVTAVLATALFAVVALDPWAMQSAGFWLSFGAVALILYVGAARLQRPGWLVDWARIQWAITVGLVPLLLVLFKQVSLVSPIANAVAIPVVSLGVVPLTLLGLLLAGRCAAGRGRQGDGPVLLAAACTECLARCRVGAGRTAGVDAAGGAGRHRLAARSARIPRALAGCCLRCCRWSACTRHGRRQEAFWLDVLDVGQGLAAVVRTADHALVYDTGPAFSSDADSGSRIVVPYLRGEGVSRLDGLIVSHNDSDHSGGTVSVLQAVPVTWVASSLPADSPLLALAARRVRCFAGQQWEWDGVRFEMLHPSWASYNVAATRDNDRSCVLRVVAAGGSVLLTADIERGAEAQVLERAPAHCGGGRAPGPPPWQRNFVQRWLPRSGPPAHRHRSGRVSQSLRPSCGRGAGALHGARRNRVSHRPRRRAAHALRRRGLGAGRGARCDRRYWQER